MVFNIESFGFKVESRHVEGFPPYALLKFRGEEITPVVSREQACDVARDWIKTFNIQPRD